MTRYLYWLKKNDFQRARKFLTEKGFQLSPTFLTPCQVLKATDDRVLFATPEVWSRVCKRQSSWYQSSTRSGQTMMMSARRLPEEMDRFLYAELGPSDFQPERLPGVGELKALVNSAPYREGKPPEWEGKTWKDAFMFKTLFTLTRFWGRGDNLKRHWTGHRANHANFLAGHFTTDIDGEEVPYSVTGNEGVCSSCAEFFNVVAPSSRKLVRSCPGAVTFGGAPREVFVDVKPVSRVAV